MRGRRCELRVLNAHDDGFSRSHNIESGTILKWRRLSEGDFVNGNLHKRIQVTECANFRCNEA